jgi:glutamate--cysteine ligase
MYDERSLDEALTLAPRLSREEMRELQERVAHGGLAARFEGVDVLGIAKEIVRLARSGLEAIAPAEVGYLDVLSQQVIEDEVCPADILLRNWHGSWHGSMKHVTEYLRIT